MEKQYSKMHNQWDLLHSTWSSPQCYSTQTLGGRRVWGRTDTCKCMAECLCCPPEIITLLIDYTTIQKKKFLFFKRKLVLDEFNCSFVLLYVVYLSLYLHLYFYMSIDTNI